MAEQEFKVGDRIKGWRTGAVATVLSVEEHGFDFKYDNDVRSIGHGRWAYHGFTLVDRPEEPEPEQEPEQEPERVFKAGDRIKGGDVGLMATVLDVDDAGFRYRYVDESHRVWCAGWGDHYFTLVDRPEQEFRPGDRIKGAGTGWMATVGATDSKGFAFTYDIREVSGYTTWVGGHTFTLVERPEPEPEEKTTTYRVTQVIKGRASPGTASVSFYKGDNLAVAVAALANAAIPPERDVYRIVSVTMTVEDD